MKTDEIKTAIQDAQSKLGQLQQEYSDSQLSFWALALAWEATRLAWYVADHDDASAREKLASVKTALADLERKL